MRVVAVCLLLVAASAGCHRSTAAQQNNAGEPGGSPESAAGDPGAPEFSHLITRETEYYTDGPQQGRPPDGRWAIGTKVHVIEDRGSYLLVRSEQGVEAYVAAAAVEPRAGDLSAIVEGSNEFALDLYGQLRSEPGNLFFSPSSVSTALAMTSAGAEGKTQAEMAQTLHFQMPEDQLHEGMQALQATWNATGEAGRIQLAFANRLWGQKGYPFRPEFLNVTRKRYGAELAPLDFAQQDQARRTINRWVESQTENKITDLIPASALSADTRLVLTNAVYFHGNWEAPFDEDRTEPDDFRLITGDTVEVPMMRRSDTFRYASVDGLQILELPYADNHLSMVVLLPEAVEGLAALEAELTLPNLQRWTDSVRRKEEVRVYLPRFQMTSQFELSDALGAMGMPSAFDPDAADFSGITSGRELFLSAAIHQAFVDVNEQGTEAAAATGAIAAVTAVAPTQQEPPVFRADHPFVFLIRDNRTGTVLFLGRVINPST